MTSDEARRRYLWQAQYAAQWECYCGVPHCTPDIWLDVDAASLDYDIANAIESDERIRRSVAWA